MKLIYLILVLFLIHPNLYAMPSQADKNKANTEFGSGNANQTAYFAINSRYDQKLSKTINGIQHETHVYDGPRGKGFVHIAKKVDGADTYILQQHTGPESDRNIQTEWTKVEE